MGKEKMCPCKTRGKACKARCDTRSLLDLTSVHMNRPYLADKGDLLINDLIYGSPHDRVGGTRCPPEGNPRSRTPKVPAMKRCTENMLVSVNIGLLDCVPRKKFINNSVCDSPTSVTNSVWHGRCPCNPWHLTSHVACVCTVAQLRQCSYNLRNPRFAPPFSSTGSKMLSAALNTASQ